MAIQLINIMKITSHFLAVFLLANIVLAHNPHKPNPALIPTLVTAWWPVANSASSLPQGDELATFEKLLQLKTNLIIFGEKALGDFVAKKRDAANTKFVELDAKTLTESWYYKLANELKKKGQVTKAVDAVSPILSYSRMVLLNKAFEHDIFNADEFIWIDSNALASYQISKIVEPKNTDSLLVAFNHHFFILTADKNADVHVFPNAEKTYFQTNFTTFVGSQLFGGKRQAIQTIYAIYEDLLKVVIQYDGNLWSENALLSLLADRCTFLISYLSAEDIKPPASNRLLQADDVEDRFQEEKAELERYEWLIGMCELGIVIVGILLAWQIIKFLKFTKKYQRLQSEVGMQASSLNSVNQ